MMARKETELSSVNVAAKVLTKRTDEDQGMRFRLCEVECPLLAASDIRLETGADDDAQI